MSEDDEKCWVIAWKAPTGTEGQGTGLFTRRDAVHTAGRLNEEAWKPGGSRCSHWAKRVPVATPPAKE